MSGVLHQSGGARFLIAAVIDHIECMARMDTHCESNIASDDYLMN